MIIYYYQQRPEMKIEINSTSNVSAVFNFLFNVKRIFVKDSSKAYFY